MRVWPRHAATVVLLVAGLLGAGPARAGDNDLDLSKLCGLHAPGAGRLNGQVLECSWVRRSPAGLIEGVAVPPDAEVQFRSLMSELAVVMAPRLVVPADNLGFAGFQVAGELGMTRVNRDRPFWSAVEGVPRENTSLGRPSQWLTTAGAFVRKGVWLGLPVLELGAGMVNLLESNLLSWQGYAKLALHEGFHDQPFPSLAVRGSVGLPDRHRSGADDHHRPGRDRQQAIWGDGDVPGRALPRLEPAADRRRVLVLDATPSCDAHQVRTAMGQSLGEFCADAQRGTDNDLRANFVFPRQSAIRRQRLSAGAKVKFATVFLTAQYEFLPAGRSRDRRKTNGARDASGTQHGFALSAGFDY